MGSDSETDKSALKEKKKVVALAPIAKPLAGKKLCKRTYKLIRRGIILIFLVVFFLLIFLNFTIVIIICLIVSAAEHKCLKRGVKEVVKSIRRGHKGYIFYKKDTNLCFFKLFDIICKFT